MGDRLTTGESIRSRYSCRSFLPGDLEREFLQEILEEAQRAPSWCNAQPWQVFVTSGTETHRLRKAMMKAADAQTADFDIPPPGAYPGVLGERRREAGYALYASAGIDRADKEARRLQMLENFRLFGAPHAIVVTTDPVLGPYGLVDCGGYVSHLMLSATSRGVATIALGSLAMHARSVKAALGIPANRDVVCVVCMGYPDESAPINHFRTSRAPQMDVVTWRDGTPDRRDPYSPASTDSPR